MCHFENKGQKPDIKSRNLEFLDQKGPILGPKNIVGILILFFHDKTIIVAQKQNITMEHQNIGRKWPKTVKSTILSPQAMYC